MVVKAAGAKVRAGQAHVRQGRAVRAAADGHALRLDAVGAEGVLRALDEVEVGENFLLHVVVAVRYFGDHGALTVFAVQEIGGFGEKFLFLFKLLLSFYKQYIVCYL